MNNIRIIKIKELGSTNVYAKALLANDKPAEGTVIWALDQLEGKGLAHNKWSSFLGNSLTFSFILYPGFIDLDYQFTISMAVSLGIIDVLQQYIPSVKIKWPNDIYYDDKKLGGILIENSIFGESMKHSIVGIGLNVNGKNFPDELRNAVSMESIIKRKFDLENILHGICEAIMQRYDVLKKGGYKHIKSAYLNHLLGYMEEKIFKHKDTIFPAQVIDVEMNGPVKLLKKDGKSAKFYFKEVEMMGGF